MRDTIEVNEQSVSSLRNVSRHGSKMSKITAITAGDETFTISLACGHNIIGYPYNGMTARQWAERMQQKGDTFFKSPFIIGETRIYCSKPHKGVKP